MSAKVSFEIISAKGWTFGLRTVLHKENRARWGMRHWWVQTLIWLLGLNRLVAFVVFALPVMIVQMEGKPPDGFDPVTVGLQTFLKLGAGDRCGRDCACLWLRPR